MANPIRTGVILTLAGTIWPSTIKGGEPVAIANHSKSIDLRESPLAGTLLFSTR
jgi:hypothetical protein